MENEFIDPAELSKLKAKEEEKQTKKKRRKKTTSKRKTKKKSSKGPGMLVQILNGDFLTKEFMVKNLGFIFFFMGLLLLMVGKGYYGKRLISDVAETTEELNEVTSDYFEAKARLEEETRRTRLVEELGPRLSLIHI